jgi:hypothetical protein
MINIIFLSFVKFQGFTAYFSYEMSFYILHVFWLKTTKMYEEMLHD